MFSNFRFFGLFAALILCSTISLAQIANDATFEFTNAGAEGREGPSQIEINYAYLNSNLEGQVTAVNGIQYWTVPTTGTYLIRAIGAAGGSSTGYRGNVGLGAMMSGKFELEQGTVLKVLVGQKGEDDYYSGAGGGGSFVTLEDNSPLIIAAGGGGASEDENTDKRHHASINEDGLNSDSGSGGTDGYGGQSHSYAGGGGGLLGNGTGGGWYGYAFVKGGYVVFIMV